MGRRKNPPEHVHTIVLSLAVSPEQSRVLDSRFQAGFNLYRAAVREARKRLTRLKESRAWREACALPQDTEEEVDARNAALGGAREAHGVTEASLCDFAENTRRRSKWMMDHLDSHTASNLGKRAWDTVADHLFRGAGRPKIPKWQSFTSMKGTAPNHKDGKWQSITFTGQWQPDLEAGPAPPTVGRWDWTGPLHLAWNTRRGSSRLLCVRVKTLDASPVYSHAKARQEHALSDRGAWRAVTLVRKQILVGYHQRWVYEAHLLIEKPAWRTQDRYTSIPNEIVGVDTGPMTLAAVAINEKTGVTAARLVRPDKEQLDAAKATAKKQRRRQRATERSRRANNPEAYGAGKTNKHGSRRKGKGSQKPGVKIKRSRNEGRIRAQIKDTARKKAEDRERRAKMEAKEIVFTMGKHIQFENVGAKAWQKHWGKAVAMFAPAQLVTALEAEALKAGGSFTRVSPSLGLSQHCVCGVKVKKKLSQRVHACDCGMVGDGVHRDLFSAFLAATTIPKPENDTDTKETKTPTEKTSGKTRAGRKSKKKTSPAVGMMLDTTRACAIWQENPWARLCVQSAVSSMNETHMFTQNFDPAVSGSGFEGDAWVAGRPTAGPDPTPDRKPAKPRPTAGDGKSPQVKGENVTRKRRRKRGHKPK